VGVYRRLPSVRETYAGHAPEYEALVSREDHAGNILKAIRDIAPIEGRVVIDLGAGTGRLACLVAPYARTVLAFDLSPHMLGLARDKLRAGARAGWLTAAADHRFVPLRSGSADLIVSGWSVSYVAVWHPEQWRAELASWYSESRRLLRPGGRIILLESLGTGNELPQRLPHLTDFYAWLDETGFRSKWIRTDYRFETPEIAASVAGFFFGEEMRHKIEMQRLTILPECTGVWWIER
jgi:ubiquinone/menaquinone biosynthesis C-methylase UbiE